MNISARFRSKPADSILFPKLLWFSLELVHICLSCKFCNSPSDGAAWWKRHTDTSCHWAVAVKLWWSWAGNHCCRPKNTIWSVTEALQTQHTSLSLSCISRYHLHYDGADMRCEGVPVSLAARCCFLVLCQFWGAVSAFCSLLLHVCGSSSVSAQRPVIFSHHLQDAHE